LSLCRRVGDDRLYSRLGNDTLQDAHGLGGVDAILLAVPGSKLFLTATGILLE
jgi:hypothetical protein